MMRIPRKAGLLVGCALGAVLTAAAQPAGAQSFDGSPVVVTGSALVTTAPNTTNVTVRSQETVINWFTFDTLATGAIDFQPAGTTATFRDAALPDYTVLNRIIPLDGNSGPTAATVTFNGTVNGLLGSAPGGNIWFYSPTGIIAGPTAQFNVGSLILTTNDIQFVPNSPAGAPGSIYGPGGLVRFRGPANSTGFVDVRAGAQINATGTNAYVALVAPRVVQGGTVAVDGQVAYIAAEQVDMTINAGLFDFTLLVGTTDANGVVHTGTTTGPASTGFLDTQRISMVAMPKNDALTMLLSGSIGYTPAASAANEGSSIVLSAGFDTAEPNSFSGADDSNIEIGNATFGNSLNAWATSGIFVLPQGGTTTFGGNTFLRAGEIVQVQATAGEFVVADLDLNIIAGRPGTGGTVDLLAQTFAALPGGVIDVAGALSLRASSDGILPIGSPPLDGQGGTIALDANGGTIEAASLFATADGFGNPGAAGGTGTGGRIDVLARSAGTISAGFINLEASGFGGDGGAGGGDGVGGAVNVTENGGTLGFASVFLNATGAGGSASGIAGDGTGGMVVVGINQQAQVWDELLIDTSSRAGGPASESDGLSGSASGGEDGAILRITGPGSLAVNGDLTMTSNANMEINGASGFSGSAGKILLEVEDGGALTVAGTLSAQASALLSSGGLGLGEIPDSTPVQTGGNVRITADGGRISANALTASAEAEGLFAQTAAGSATGGAVTVSALGSGNIGTSVARISANAYGAPGPMPADALGGIARVVVSDADFTVSGDLELSADAASELLSVPPPGPGFNATGGSATIELLPGSLGTALLSAGDVAISASGDAGLNISMFSGEGVPSTPELRPIQGNGGIGTGGMAGLTMEGGTLTVDELAIDASGIGGASGISSGATPFQSGDGFGGAAQFAIGGGSATIGTLAVLSNGTGGDGTDGPAAEGSERATLAGNGTGGSAGLRLDAGSLQVTATTLEANGVGAPGMDQIDDGDASDGGTGTGGTVALVSAADWTGFFSTASLDLRANGQGGVGGYSDPGSAVPSLGTSGDGGDGIGGVSTIDLADGAFSLGAVRIEATGTGGYSGDASSGLAGAEGGYGYGGAARFALVDSPAGPAGARGLDHLFIDASGFGGVGSTIVAQSSTGEADLTVSVLAPASALTLPGSLAIYASGVDQTPTGGIRALISGAPLQVGSDVILSSDGPVVITADQPLQGGTFVSLYGFTVTTTGLVQSAGPMFVEGPFGISADRLISGATTSLDATRGPGPIIVTDLLSADRVTAAGESIDIRSSGGLDFASATASGGDLFIGTVGNLGLTSLSATGSVSLDSSAGNIATGNFTAGTWAYVDAFGTAALGDIAAGTDAAVTTRGGNLTVGNVTAGDDLWLSIFGTDATRMLTAGNLVTTGLGADGADGPPELFGGPGPTGNVTRVRSSGSLAIGDVLSPGRAILVADAGTATAGDLTADEAVIVLGRGNVALDSLATEGRFYVADSAMFLPNLPDAYDPASLDGLTPLRTSGGLAIGGAVQAGDITVAVSGTATAPSWTSAHGLLIDTGGQFVSSAEVSAGGNASVTADAGIDVASLTSGGTTVLRSPTGAIVVDDLRSTGAVTARGNDIDITSSGTLAFDDVAALLGDASIDTAGGLTIASIVASDAIALESGGPFTLSGTARGVSIDVTSADIVLASGAALGVRGTTRTLTLRNGDTDGDTFIGGEGQAGDYSLDRNEAARMFADESITLLADGDITIGDLALNFGSGANIGTGGTLEISSPEEITITGDVALRTSSADDTFRIDPRLIALRTDTGSISMFTGEGVGGTPQGRLELLGDRIVAATAATIDQLETLTDLDAISELLGQPGGTGEPLSAGTIHIDVIESLFIQNSGASNAFADRRGFAASGVEIATESGATQIAINGRIITPGGSVTGLEVTPLVEINGVPAAAGGQFHARSTVNGCVIGQNCAPRELDLPTREDVESPVIGEGGGPLFIAPLIELAGTDPLITPPLVDEPITGVGNDDLWEPPCEPDDEDAPCPEEDDGER